MKRRDFIKGLGITAFGLAAYSHFGRNTTFGAIPYEMAEKRTRNSRTTNLGNGSYRLQSSMGAIHRKVNGNWQPINNEIVAGVMNQADYSLTLLQNTFNAGQVAQFGVQGETVLFQPMALEWTNDLNQISQISMPKAVVGVITNTPSPIVSNLDNKTGKVKWTGAYGTGIDFEWECQTEQLAKKLTINSLGNLTTPPAAIISGGNPALRLNFIFAPSAGLDIYVDGILWDKRATVQTFNQIQFRKGTNIVWGFSPLVHWDSSPLKNIGYSKATLRRSGNDLYVEIRVPYAWLQTATFPIVIDPTIGLLIQANNDMCWYRGSDGYWVVGNATYISCGAYSPSNHSFGGGMQWDLNIPQGKNIDTCTIIGRADRTTGYDAGNLCRTRFSVEDVDNAGAWSTSGDYTTRWTARHATRITWDGIAGWTLDSDYTSPELKTILQIPISRVGWAANQRVSIFWDDHERRSAEPTSFVAMRGWHDRSVTTTNCPRIDITYSDAVSAFTPIMNWW